MTVLPARYDDDDDSCYIFISASYQTGFDTRSFYNGLIGDRKIGHE